MLTAIRQKEGEEIRLFCGCFTGSVEELKTYIANGEKRYAKSRTVAMETVLMLLEIKKEATP